MDSNRIYKKVYEFTDLKAVVKDIFGEYDNRSLFKRSNES